MATATADGFGMAGNVALPNGVARLGRAGLLTFGAALLDHLDDRLAQEQITKAVARFGLDPSRPADVVAASAYVWSRYRLPLFTKAGYTGPDLDAASQAVMRFALVDPGAFIARDRDAKSFSLVIDAANAGLSDYVAESRARPAGVDPALQTKSESARAMIASQLKAGNMQAHHLVPAYVWGQNIDITKLAYQAGWRVDDPSNLIALPADEATREALGEMLPLHNSFHKEYNNTTQAMIELKRAEFPTILTPLEARSILEYVAALNLDLILSGKYGPIIKVGA